MQSVSFSLSNNKDTLTTITQILYVLLSAMNCICFLLFFFVSIELFVEHSHAHLCGRVYKRGSTTQGFNLTLNEHGVARGIFTIKKTGFIFAEPNCQVNIDKGAVMFGHAGDPGWDMEHTVGGNRPGEYHLCCTCRPQTCEMIQLGSACARLFAGDNCDTCAVEGLTVNDGEKEENMKYGTEESKTIKPPAKRRFWLGEGILSVVVNWGCKLVLYEKPNYEGMRRIYYNGIDARFGNGKGWGNPTKSYTCDCQRPPIQRVAEWITLVSGNLTGNGTISAENRGYNSTTQANIGIDPIDEFRLNNKTDDYVDDEFPPMDYEDN